MVVEVGKLWSSMKWGLENGKAMEDCCAEEGQLNKKLRWKALVKFQADAMMTKCLKMLT